MLRLQAFLSSRIKFIVFYQLNIEARNFFLPKCHCFFNPSDSYAADSYAAESYIIKTSPKVRSNILVDKIHPNFFQTMEKYSEAEAMHLKAIEIKEAILGKHDYEVALSIGHLASLYNYDLK